MAKGTPPLGLDGGGEEEMNQVKGEEEIENAKCEIFVIEKAVPLHLSPFSLHHSLSSPVLHPCGKV